MSTSNKKLHTKKALIDALHESLGIVTTACKAVGVDRATYYRYINDDPQFAKEAKEVENTALDFVESQLYKQIRAENITAIIFYMKTKGKKRGYIERIESITKVVDDFSDMTDEQIDEQIRELVKV